jgi:putative flavoprotein involved in K+ transport
MSETSAQRVIANWLSRFEAALKRKDIPAVLELLESDCYWRDLLSFTWNMAVFEGHDEIARMLSARLADTAPSGFIANDRTAKKEGDVVQGSFQFESRVGRGSGYVRLRDGRCWTLLTTLTELKGHEEPLRDRRDLAVAQSYSSPKPNWLERRREEEARLGYSQQPYVVIVGGGQGGLGLAARLKMLGVPAIIVDRNARPGDAWRKRYKSLHTHSPVWTDDLPYVPFPDHWPVFSPKDKLGNWLENYASIMDLVFWGSTEAERASYDESAEEWAVTVRRKSGEAVVLRPKHLVFATGMSGRPNVPDFPGAKTFAGAIYHSSEYPGSEEYAGKKAVVVGSNNSAFDIAADLFIHGTDVTMVQRSSTCVIRSDSMVELVNRPLYSEEARRAGITVEDADLEDASLPFRLMPSFHTPVYAQIAERDRDLYDRLRKVGFMLDFGEDGSGLLVKYYRRGSGYYIDVGGADLVADEKIKVRSGFNVERIEPDGLVLTNGEKLRADLIVFATGYLSMDLWVADIVSPEAAAKVGRVWGLGSGTTLDPGPWEGELRNMWKPTRLEGVWFHGGNIQQARYYSRTLALQLKARMEGIDTPVYPPMN